MAAAQAYNYNYNYNVILVLVLLQYLVNNNAVLVAASSNNSSESESDYLLAFKESLQNTSTALLPSWVASTSPCSSTDHKSNWEGVLCSQQGKIWGLKLENMGLNGLIDVKSLKKLPDLRTISLMNNYFGGALPDVGQLDSLKSLYLSNNRFSGEIDNAIFSRMLSLKKLHLDHNQFRGGIPESLAYLPKLVVLRLDANQFEGHIPNFGFRTWYAFNVSNNALQGQIPQTLTKVDATAFSGNDDLCGVPLKRCPSDKPSVLSIVVVVVVVLMALAAIGAVIFILTRRKRTSESMESSPPKTEEEAAAHHESSSSSTHTSINGTATNSGSRSGSVSGSTTARKAAGGGGHHHHHHQQENLKLWFVRDDRERFDMQDLLKASAEILGSGSFGSSYKAALLSGAVMVVKRFKQMNNVARDEFHEHMRRIGRLRHPNLLPLVAYYYKKEEKLLVSDYVQNGSSLALYLHGGQGQVPIWLDWRRRLKIVKGVARGLLYLQQELPTVMAAHGHLKSSNVLVKTETEEAQLSDYGLIPVTNQEHAQQIMVAYKSPEYLTHRRITKKTDVWSLGILILEILTAKLPANFVTTTGTSTSINGAEKEDLVSWVSSVGEAELFDAQLTAASDEFQKGEMVKLLKIGMGCCQVDVDKRWDIKQALEKIEDLKDDFVNITQNYLSSDHPPPPPPPPTTTTTNDIVDEDFYSSCASEMDMRSSKAMSDEFITFSIKGPI